MSPEVGGNCAKETISVKTILYEMLGSSISGLFILVKRRLPEGRNPVILTGFCIFGYKKDSLLNVDFETGHMIPFFVGIHLRQMSARIA